MTAAVPHDTCSRCGRSIPDVGARIFYAGKGPMHIECFADASLPPIVQPPPEMLDLQEHPDEVEIVISPSGTIWINVDGRCRFRVHRAKYVGVLRSSRVIYDQGQR